MCSEGLLAEFFVAAVLDSIQLEPVRIGVDVVILGEQVGDRIHGGRHQEDHHQHNLLVGYSAAAQIGDVF